MTLQASHSAAVHDKIVREFNEYGPGSQHSHNQCECKCSAQLLEYLFHRHSAFRQHPLAGHWPSLLNRPTVRRLCLGINSGDRDDIMNTNIIRQIFNSIQITRVPTFWTLLTNRRRTIPYSMLRKSFTDLLNKLPKLAPRTLLQNYPDSKEEIGHQYGHEGGRPIRRKIDISTSLNHADNEPLAKLEGQPKYFEARCPSEVRSLYVQRRMQTAKTLLFFSFNTLATEMTILNESKREGNIRKTIHCHMKNTTILLGPSTSLLALQQIDSIT